MRGHIRELDQLLVLRRLETLPDFRLHHGDVARTEGETWT
jgi:hypothetical protein